MFPHWWLLSELSHSVAQPQQVRVWSVVPLSFLLYLYESVTQCVNMHLIASTAWLILLACMFFLCVCWDLVENLEHLISL